jgi:hypothetical protein
MEVTRAEHVKWCKQRARQEYDFKKADNPEEARQNAVNSMLSDLGKHAETAGTVGLAFMMSMEVRDERSLFRFIYGFTE